MKKNISKFIPIIMLAMTTIFSCNSVYAEYNPDKIYSENEVATKSAIQKNAIIIDDKALEDAEIIISEEVQMFPARKVFEALGYTVEWNGEDSSVAVSKLPHYVTFIIGVDGYTFARTAPMPLNKAPELIDGVTYVPVSLLTEIMNLDAVIDENDNLKIKTVIEEDETIENSTEADQNSTNEEASEEESNVNDNIEQNAEVISIAEGSILVNDKNQGEISLVLSENTELLFDDNTEASLEDIKEASKLYVEYSGAMTMSIPPINNPEKIVIFK